MGGRREVSIIFYRPVTRSDLKQERLFFRGSVSSFLQLVVASLGSEHRNTDTHVAHQCCDQLTAVKTRYPLTSIT